MNKRSKITNKLPWFPFYYQLWMTDIDVRMLSNAERGIYLDMLCFCYSENGLPDDRKILDRVFPCEKEELDLLLTFFISKEGRLHHPKLDAIREDQGAVAKARSKAGKKSAQVKKAQALRAEGEGQQNSTRVGHVLDKEATDPPTDPQQNSTITQHNITQHNSTPPTGGLGGESGELSLEVDTPPETDPTPEQRTEFLRKFWEMTPGLGRERSSKKKVAAAWDAIKKSDRPPFEVVLDAMEAWCRSESWTKDGGKFVQGIHIWLNDQQWEQIPDAAASQSKANRKSTTDGPVGWLDEFRKLMPKSYDPHNWLHVDLDIREEIEKALKGGKDA